MQKWDDHQLHVIEAPVELRIVVTAPPGSGKTDVACARISYLIEKLDIEPGKILLISFARTTIAGLRDRIRKFAAEENSIVLGIRISTVDSQAWNILNGFNRDKAFEGIFSSYAENIEKTIEFLTNSESDDLNTYLQSFRHVIIDEAQDIVGERVTLLSRLSDRLSADCGITVLGDNSQAIYDFTLETEPDESKHDNKVQNLISTILAERGLGGGIWLLDVELERNYRTKNNELLESQNKLRSLISNEIKKNEYDEIIKILKNLKLSKNSRIPNSKFVLCRSRIEVLSRASYLYQEEKPHKLKIGALPKVINPWIAILFMDFELKRFNLDDFLKQYHTKCELFPDNKYLKELDPGDAFKRMLLFARTKNGLNVDLYELRNTLYNPPPEFLCGEYGYDGETICTIHAAKGLEADHVTLVLPPLDSDKDYQFTDEGKILYVGATRAVQVLDIENGSRMYGKRLDGSGRVFKTFNGKAQVEIGMEGDFINHSTIHDGSIIRDASSVHKIQTKLIQNAGKFIYGRLERETSSRKFRLFMGFEEEGKENIHYIGDMSMQFWWDIRSVSRILYGGKDCIVNNKINYISSYGIGTGVLNPDDIRDDYSKIPSKYERNGFYVYPLIRGFSVLSPTLYRGINAFKR